MAVNKMIISGLVQRVTPNQSVSVLSVGPAAGATNPTENVILASPDPASPLAVDVPDLTLSHYNGHAAFGVFKADEGLNGWDDS